MRSLVLFDKAPQLSSSPDSVALSPQAKALIQQQSDKISELQDWGKQKDAKIQELNLKVQSLAAALQKEKDRSTELEARVNDIPFEHEQQITELNQRILNQSAELRHLQKQVSISNIEAVKVAQEDARQARRIADNCRRFQEEAEDDAARQIEEACTRADKAEREKHDGIERANHAAKTLVRQARAKIRLKMILSMAYGVTVTIVLIIILLNPEQI